MLVPTQKNQTVGKNPTLLGTPTLQTPQISAPVRGAFGEDVAQAGERLGNTIERSAAILSEHIQKMNTWKSTEKGQVAGNKLNDISLNTLNSTELEDVKNPDGTTSKRVKGILNQQGHTADGAVIRYVEEMSKQHTDILESLKNDPVALQAYKQRAESVLNAGKETAIKHQSTEWRNASKSSIIENIDSEVSGFPLLDSNEKKVTIDRVNGRLQEANSLGIMDYKEIESARTKFYNDIVEGDISRDIATEDKASLVLAELKKGKDGEYYFLPDVDRMKLEDKARSHIKDVKLNVESNYIVQQSDILKNWTTVTPDQISSAWQSGGISADFARKAIAAKTDAKNVVNNLTAEGDTTYKGYQELVKQALKSGVNTKDMQIKIAESYGKGEIKDTNVAEIMAILELDNKAPARTAFTLLDSRLVGLSHKERTRMLNELGTSIFRGTPAEQLPAKANELADKATIENNPDRTKYEIGKIYPSLVPGGKSFKVNGYYDDGEPDVEFIDK